MLKVEVAEKKATPVSCYLISLSTRFVLACFIYEDASNEFKSKK